MATRVLERTSAMVGQAAGTMSNIPARFDRLPWSRIHRRIVLILGIAFVLDGFWASGIGSALAFGRFSAMIGPIVLAAMLQSGLTRAFVVTGLVLLAGALMEVVWGIEGRGRSLEAIASGK